MTEMEVRVRPGADLSGAEHVVEESGAAAGLRQTLKGTLARCPGCVHWHFKSGDDRGTLEVTLWPARRRIWLSVKSGRTGTWIEEAAARLRAAIESQTA
jgi:hypothetical protein